MDCRYVVTLSCQKFFFGVCAHLIILPPPITEHVVFETFADVLKFKALFPFVRTTIVGIIYSTFQSSTLAKGRVKKQEN